MKLEDGIDVPKINGGSAAKYPFNNMGVGQSVFFAGEKTHSPKGKPVSAAHKYASKSGKKFAVRSVDGGVRIWRIE